MLPVLEKLLLELELPVLELEVGVVVAVVPEDEPVELLVVLLVRVVLLELLEVLVLFRNGQGVTPSDGLNTFCAPALAGKHKAATKIPNNQHVRLLMFVRSCFFFEVSTLSTIMFYARAVRPPSNPQLHSLPASLNFKTSLPACLRVPFCLSRLSVCNFVATLFVAGLSIRLHSLFFCFPLCPLSYFPVPCFLFFRLPIGQCKLLKLLLNFSILQLFTACDQPAFLFV